MAATARLLGQVSRISTTGRNISGPAQRKRYSRAWRARVRLTSPPKGVGGGVQRRFDRRISSARRRSSDSRHPVRPDQLLAAAAIRHAGAGLLLGAAKVTAAKVRATVERVMREESFTEAAQRVAESFAGFDPHARFRAVVDEVIAHSATANGAIQGTAP